MQEAHRLTKVRLCAWYGLRRAGLFLLGGRGGLACGGSLAGGGLPGRGALARGSGFAGRRGLATGSLAGRGGGGPRNGFFAFHLLHGLADRRLAVADLRQTQRAVSTLGPL